MPAVVVAWIEILIDELKNGNYEYSAGKLSIFI
jgi:hypothetical protein